MNTTEKIQDASSTTVFVIAPDCISCSPEGRILLDTVYLTCRKRDDRPRIPVTVIQQGSTYYTPLNTLYKNNYHCAINNYCIYYKHQFMTINQLREAIKK